MNKFLILLLLCSLSIFAFADYDSALAAYEAGDHEKAYKLLLPLAEAGDAKAQHSLCGMYHEGLGVSQDYAEAVKWCSKAAVQGLAHAQINLGGMYNQGLGVPQDIAEALKWYRKAAEQGYTLAQSNIGFIYYKGFGVPKDYVQAFAWLDIAVKGGFQPAQNLRDMIVVKLNAAQFKEARKLAKELSEKYGNKTKN